MSAKTLLTEADFDALEAREGFKAELDGGELVMTASPNLLHNRVRDRLGRALANYAESHGLGEVTWESDFWLGEATIRIPDLAFWRSGHAPAPDSEQRPQGAPDWAIEVVSPSNSARDLARKVRQYLHAGAELVWVVYPEDQVAHIFRPGDRPEIREAHQSLDAPELLPGWTMTLAELVGGKKSN